MLCGDSRRPLTGDDLEHDGLLFGGGTAVIAAIWLALYGWLAAAAATNSLGDMIAVAHAMQ